VSVSNVVLIPSNRVCFRPVLAGSGTKHNEDYFLFIFSLFIPAFLLFLRSCIVVAEVKAVVDARH